MSDHEWTCPACGVPLSQLPKRHKAKVTDWGTTCPNRPLKEYVVTVGGPDGQGGPVEGLTVWAGGSAAKPS